MIPRKYYAVNSSRLPELFRDNILFTSRDDNLPKDKFNSDGSNCIKEWFKVEENPEIIEEILQHEMELFECTQKTMEEDISDNEDGDRSQTQRENIEEGKSKSNAISSVTAKDLLFQLLEYSRIHKYDVSSQLIVKLTATLMKEERDGRKLSQSTLFDMFVTKNST